MLSVWSYKEGERGCALWPRVRKAWGALQVRLLLTNTPNVPVQVLQVASRNFRRLSASKWLRSPGAIFPSYHIGVKLLSRI